MLKFFISAAATSAMGMSVDLASYTFDNYVVDFDKTYREGHERVLRQQIFEDNLIKIKSHNAQGLSWTMGVNQYADLTEDEFRSLKAKGYNKHHGFAQASSVNYDEAISGKVVDIAQLPTSVDWRTKNVVTKVKDQGACGSCWAFGSTETVESYYALKTGKLLVLSEQELVSCSKNPDHCGGTGGCQGSTAELAFEYVKEHGQSTESVYPYTSGFTGANGLCKDSKTTAVNLTGYVKLPANNYTAVLNAIAATGPLAITVDAGPWQLYSGGVFTPYSYSSVDLDHVVQLVGYGSDPDGGDYWLVRNSWNEGWGESGYIRLARKDGSNKWCGKDNQPGDGTGCKGGPSVITACGTSGILYDTSYPVV